MNYKALFRKVTLPFGFTLGRIPKMKRLFYYKEQKPLYIEFIGASGVGKSTLYKKLNKRFRANWIDIRHFEELNKDQVSKLITNLPPYYNKIAKSRYTKVSEETSSYLEKLNAFRTGYNILMQDGLLHLHNKSDLVMSDEGLLQFFSQGIINLYEQDKEGLLKLLKNRAFIYCYAPVNVIVERILFRKNKTGHLWYKHKGANRKELLKVVQRNKEEIENLIAVLEEYVPVLKIDTTKPYKENNKQILSFINRILIN